MYLVFVILNTYSYNGYHSCVYVSYTTRKMTCSRVSKALAKRQKMLRKAFSAFVSAFAQNVATADVGNVTSIFKNAGNITSVWAGISQTLGKIFPAGVVPAPITLSPAFF